jgi:hypothetical protein
MMNLKELTARNLSAAIREVSNAQIVAQFEPYNQAGREVSESVLKNIYEARLLLEMAQEELQGKTPKK